MSDAQRTDAEAAAINDEMVRRMEERRQQLPERRQARGTGTGPIERRRTCAFCFQPGDHPTPAYCLRALERG